MKEYLSINEALQVLNISRPTLYRYIQTGKLKAVKHVNRTLIVAASANDMNTITPLN